VPARCAHPGTLGSSPVRIQESFTVPPPVDDVWEYLLDVERVAPCMPGAELTETIDATHWKGLVNVTFGPMTMTFRGTVALEERDDAAHRVLLAAKGMEQRGKGAANATIAASLEPADGATRVSMEADITLSGAAAQLSRGLLPEVSKQLTARFADCLRQNLVDLTGEPPANAKPVGGLRLSVAAAWAAVVRLVRALFGGRKNKIAP
jgi:carbon monoxide dehydrogenase subunit G